MSFEPPSSPRADQTSVSTNRPTLPSEIVDQILRDEGLSKSDLARCCLLSRQFLPIPRNELYKSINFNLFAQSGVAYWFHDSEAVSLLSTLENNIALRQKVKKLELLGFEVEPVDKNTRSNAELNDGHTPEAMVKRIFDLLPDVKSLSFNGTLQCLSGTTYLILSYGQRWEALSVEAFLFGRHFDATRSITELSNLKRLSCYELSLQLRYDWTLPDGLQVLEMVYQQAGFIKGSTKSQLRLARLALVDDKLRYIDTFQQLQSLYLFQGLGNTRISFLPPISKLSRLQTLSFHLIDNQLFAVETLPHILANLPLSLSRLEFPKIVPFAAITSFLKSSSVPPLLQVVALDVECQLDDLHENKLEELSALCQAKKIKVEWVTAQSEVLFL